jgi:hypothetical protein
MRRTDFRMSLAIQALVGLLGAALVVAVPGAQTRVSPPKNKFTPQQDVELGREAAAEIEKQLPLLDRAGAREYVQSVGLNLLRAAPRELDHPEFEYTFKVVNVRDLNAFALPGGPMYVNRGMIEASASEGEVAGVMAHEISHVLLRHGTAQATKAERFQFGALAGAILGAVIGGNTGQAISQGTQFGLGTYFLKFSREYEKDADLLGAQIMAGAGYDPRDLAKVFRTIEEKSGSGGPQWLSDHPNPGNRYEYINQEASRLRIANTRRSDAAYQQLRDELRRLPAAPSTEELNRSASGNRGSGSTPRGRIESRVEAPSSRYRTYREGDLFQVSVPGNWQELPSGTNVWFSPSGGHGEVRGREVFTHGVEFGLSRGESHGLREATEELVDALARSNARLRRESDYRPVSFAGRSGLTVALSNVSEFDGRPESVTLTTTTLRDGSLFYAVTVAPRDDTRVYDSVFTRVLRSIRFTR